MEPIEEVYFSWLYTKVASTSARTPSLTYWNLIRFLHHTEFVWLIVGDDNRAEDGQDLRHEFEVESGMVGDDEWHRIGCSVLEMLIALARKAEFLTDIPAKEWFWKFLENLGLADLDDSRHHIEHQVGGALERLIWRTYKPSGKGGLFPMTRPPFDQRTVELWYQLNEYVDEQQKY